MSNYPPYIRKKLQITKGKVPYVEHLLRQNKVHTVCESARCPNQIECFHKGVATFMILGKICTRRCRFCAVEKGEPMPADPTEPGRVARVVKKLNLRHVVITSVTRDDLKDGGAEHFAITVRAIRESNPGTTVEVLTPDFNGSIEALNTVIKELPEVFNHNVETVPRLYSEIRAGADYRRSLKILQKAKELSNGKSIIKSGIMVGLGETQDEVVAVMQDLRAAGCDVITIGQYLSPSKHNYPVQEYVSPEQFKLYYMLAEDLGFRYVFSDVFVRSSYRSEEVIKKVISV